MTASVNTTANVDMSVKTHTNSHIFYITGLIFTILFSMYYFSTFEFFNHFIDKVIIENINSYAFSAVFILLTFFLANKAINRNLSPIKSILISVFFTLMLMGMQISRFIFTLDITDPNSVGTLDNQVIFTILTLAFGIIIGVVSFFITKTIKNPPEVRDRTRHSALI